MWATKGRRDRNTRRPLHGHTNVCILSPGTSQSLDDKTLLWIGTSRRDLRRLPSDARGQIGFDLRLVQCGESPRDWKPMPSVGTGVAEIRVHIGGEYRALYAAKFSEGIYVLHIFQKKSRKTASFDIDLARARYSAMLRARSRG